MDPVFFLRGCPAFWASPKYKCRTSSIIFGYMETTAKHDRQNGDDASETTKAARSTPWKFNSWPLKIGKKCEFRKGKRLRFSHYFPGKKTRLLNFRGVVSFKEC